MYLLFDLLIQDAKTKQVEIPEITASELLALIESQKDILNEANQPCLVHTDTWPGNLMIKDKQLSGLIDHAAVLYGDPLMNHDFHDFDDLNENFLRGFGKTKVTYKEQIRITIYKLWHRLGMIVERGYRNYEDKNQYAWVLKEFSKEVKNLKNMLNV